MRFSYMAPADHFSAQVGEAVLSYLLMPRENLQMWVDRQSVQKGRVQPRLVALEMLEFSNFDDWHYLEEILGKDMSSKIRDFQSEVGQIEFPRLDVVSTEEELEEVLSRGHFEAHMVEVQPSPEGLLLGILDAAQYMGFSVVEG